MKLFTSANVFSLPMFALLVLPSVIARAFPSITSSTSVHRSNSLNQPTSVAWTGFSERKVNLDLPKRDDIDDAEAAADEEQVQADEAQAEADIAQQKADEAQQAAEEAAEATREALKRKIRKRDEGDDDNAAAEAIDEAVAEADAAQAEEDAAQAEADAEQQAADLAAQQAELEEQAEILEQQIEDAAADAAASSTESGSVRRPLN